MTQGLPEWLQTMGHIFLAILMAVAAALILFLFIGGAVMLTKDILEERRERKKWEGKKVTWSD